MKFPSLKLILFQNDFPLFQIRFNPKISTLEVLSSSSQIKCKINPLISGSEITLLSQRKIIRTITQGQRKRPLDSISFDNYRKFAEANAK